MKLRKLIACSLAWFSTTAQATVTTFTSPVDFRAATTDQRLIESFEDSDPTLRSDFSLGDVTMPSYSGPEGQITFVAIDSSPYFPNIVLASPGFANFGTGVNPTTSVILTAFGNEDFVGNINEPAYALGFDVFLNDSPLILSFFNRSTLLATLTFDMPREAGNNMAFAGISSTEGVTSFHWQASSGQNFNTGIDNIYIAQPAGVPEPGTWALMLLGFGVVGFCARRSRKDSTAIAL